MRIAQTAVTVAILFAITGCCWMKKEGRPCPAPYPAEAPAPARSESASPPAPAAEASYPEPPAPVREEVSYPEVPAAAPPNVAPEHAQARPAPQTEVVPGMPGRAPKRRNTVGQAARGGNSTKSDNNIELPNWNRIISEKLKQYPPGSIAFNPQKVMRVTKWYTVEAAISKKLLSEASRNELKTTMKDQRFVQYTSLKFVSEFMKLQLVGTSPEDFKISPAEAVEKNVNDGIERWTWQIQPQSSGHKVLKLRVIAVIKNQDLNEVCSKDIVELEKPIEVRIIPSYIPEVILGFTDKHVKTLQWVFGGGFGATLLGFLFKRFRRSDANNPPASGPTNGGSG